MDIIRLGDRLSETNQSTPRGIRFINAEYLAQTIFDPLPKPEEITDWFIQSQPIDETEAFQEVVSTASRKLGKYEVKLIDKLINPKRPVLVIYGPMGSGKTTVKNYIALNLVKNRKHCEKCDRRSKRLIAQINFDEHIYLNDLSGAMLSTKFNTILCDELQSRITNDMTLLEKEEFIDFWNYELNRFLEHRSSSQAFRKIATKFKYLNNPGEISEAEISERSKFRRQIERNKELYLDYLIHLWTYLLKFFFCGNSGCAYIILDNVDRVDVVVQRKIVDIIHTFAIMGGPTFLVIVRPETFDFMGLGTGIIDVEKHNGPKVIEVVKQRLDLFCKTPEKYYESGRGLAPEEFEIIKKFMINVNKEILNDKHQNFSDFLDNACGRSVRNGLLTMQSFFNVSKADMLNESLSSRDLVRICIRSGDDQMHWSPGHHINHMFRVASQSSECLLVKPRILRYLGRHDRNKRRLNEIINTLLGFNYDENMILGALNDLMWINSQLIRSNGFNIYEDDALRKHGGNNIILTEVGKGYSNYLLSNIDYLQEVMLDTHVDGDRFPKEISYGYLVDKFKLLYWFLNELRRVDIEETEFFVERWTEEGYKKAFGEHLITLDIIQGVYQPVIGILDSEKRDRYEVEELMDFFRSLVLNVEADNRRILNTGIISLIPARSK